MGAETGSRNVNPEIERIVRDIGIPPCPRVILDFMEEMRRDDPDFRKLSTIINSDAGLSAAVLKTANSPIYGLRTRATTVQQACTYLGLRSTALLISGLLLRRAFPVEKSAAMDTLWRLASGTAGMAMALVPKFSGVDRDTAHTFVLFRDCGQAVLLQKFPDYATLIEGSASKDSASVTHLELSRYGMHHALIGSALAESWNLPETICDAIRYHHAYGAIAQGQQALARASIRLVALGVLSEQVYWRTSARTASPEWEPAKDLVRAELGVEDTHLPSLIKMLTEAREDAAA